MMPRPTISDICLITPSVEDGIAFYAGKLGFTVRSRMPGFVDFAGPGVILALWEAPQLLKTTGIPGHSAEGAGRGVMLACELEHPDEVDRVYTEFGQRGVEFYGPPADYAWNARCVYFAGPSGEFWEFFAWYEGGEPGIEDPLTIGADS
jgi:catechol 2,3-dioxygenase-like lactoylglutathione lyase family enzyme